VDERIGFLEYPQKISSNKNDFLLSEANQRINVEHDQNTMQRFNEWEKLTFHNLDEFIKIRNKYQDK